jgi:uncharacterized protein (TIGR02266 family)
MSDDQPPSHSERRSFPRMPVEVDIGFFSESNFYAGLTQDISEGGLFVATQRILPIGTDVTVSFTLPGVHEIKTEGVVMWVRQPVDGVAGMGVRFTRLTSDDKAVIQRFVSKRAPLYHDEDDL